jgi:F-type H+-transporting ATPase subunit alpha
MPVEKQVAIIYLGTQGLLRDIPVRRVKEFEEHFLMEMDIIARSVDPIQAR